MKAVSLAIIILVLAMVFFRVYNAGYNPQTHSSLVADEARVNNIAKNLAEKGLYLYSEGFSEHDLSLGGSSIFWTGPLTIYALAMPFFFFGATYATERIFIGILSLVLVFMMYKIASRLYNRNAGIIAALISGLHPLMVFTSRIALHDILSFLLITIAAYIILFREQEAHVFAGISYALSTAAKYSGALLYPVTLIYYIIKRDGKGIAMLTAGFLFIVLFSLLFFALNPGFVQPFFLSLSRNVSHAGFGAISYQLNPIPLLSTIAFYFPFISLAFLVKVIRKEVYRKELFLWIWAIIGFLWWTTSLGTGKYGLMFALPLMILVAPVVAKRGWIMIPMMLFYLSASFLLVADFRDASVYELSNRIETLDSRAYFSEPDIAFVSGKSMIPTFWLSGTDWRFDTEGFEIYYSQPINETASQYINRTMPEYIILSDIAVSQGHSPRAEMREAIVLHGQLMERIGPYRVYILDWSRINNPLYDLKKDIAPQSNLLSFIKSLFGSK